MKKSLIVMLGLVMATFLAACQDQPVDNPDVDNNVVIDANEVDNWWDADNGEDVDNGEEAQAKKTSLTIEELDDIDASLFPTSYTYETYNWDENGTSESGEYVYPEDIDHSLLIPVHATMASREITSSSIEDGMIYTVANVTLQDGTVLSVLYINDPVTLQYVAASVNSEKETSLYTFQY